MSFALRRLLQLPAVLLGVSLVVFATMSLMPGDPALAILGPYATPERLESLRAQLDLDRPWPLRYASWLSRALRGDLGRSTSLERPVADEVVERLAATAQLASASLLVAVGVGLLAGAFAALRHGRATDRVLTLASVGGLATPPFWLAMLLVFGFAVLVPVLPASGMERVTADGGLLDRLRHLVLPTLALAVVPASVLARVMRTATLEALSAAHVGVARTRGLSGARLAGSHVFRNALVGVVPIVGLQAGYVLGGAVYVETVFQWPGLGRMLVDAVAARDVVLVQGGVLVMAVGYVLFNLAADLLQAALDPRIRS